MCTKKKKNFSEITTQKNVDMNMKYRLLSFSFFVAVFVGYLMAKPSFKKDSSDTI